MKTIICSVFLAMATGCATQPPRIAETQSGKPEVLINTTDRQAVKQSIIGKNATTGWSLEQESDSLLLFRRPFDEKTVIFGSALLGAGAMAKGMTIRYTIVQFDGKIKVLAAPFNDADSTEFNTLHLQLQSIKQEFEK